MKFTVIDTIKMKLVADLLNEDEIIEFCKSKDVNLMLKHIKGYVKNTTLLDNRYMILDSSKPKSYYNINHVPTRYTIRKNNEFLNSLLEMLPNRSQIYKLGSNGEILKTYESYEECINDNELTNGNLRVIINRVLKNDKYPKFCKASQYKELITKLSNEK